MRRTNDDLKGWWNGLSGRASLLCEELKNISAEVAVRLSLLMIQSGALISSACVGNRNAARENGRGGGLMPVERTSPY